MKRLLLASACAAMLSGCLSSEPQSGGEDFPNTVSALGRALALGMDSSQSWNGLDSAQTSLSVPPGATDSSILRAAGARRLAAACVDTGYGGLLGGSRAYFVKNVCVGVADGYKRDSLAFGGYFEKMKESDIDTVFMSRSDSVRPLLGFSRSESVTDASGRGYFLQKSDTGRVRVSTVRKLGRLSDVSDLVLGTGPDRRFSTLADNEFWTGSHGVLRDGDTVDWMDIRPAIAGVPVIGVGDSGLALATKVAIGASHRKVERGILVAFRDESKNYPRRWETKHFWDNGGFREESVLGPKPDSTFRPRDTVLVLQRAQVRGDSLRQEIRALMGPDPRNRKQDSLLSVRSIRYRSGGAERKTVWEFQSDRPVADGSEPVSGRILVRIDFAEGSYIEFDGTWKDGQFAGTWWDGKQSRPVRFGRKGEVR
ncbi:MAG: hypothetical protein IPK50_12130 [Fibrobacterota bacterium]|nr:hypothetical protein [Fibrobacterota bacterium]QQS03061.1 MAG: hypothetical protein IPK50_12130 [Fibrobacterota bacterium]